MHFRTTWVTIGNFSHLRLGSLVRYFGEMQRHFGKVMGITDRVSLHLYNLVRKLLRKNENVRSIYLSKGSPHLNTVGGTWHRAKLEN